MTEKLCPLSSGDEGNTDPAPAGAPPYLCFHFRDVYASGFKFPKANSLELDLWVLALQAKGSVKTAGSGAQRAWKGLKDLGKGGLRIWVSQLWNPRGEIS